MLDYIVTQSFDENSHKSVLLFHRISLFKYRSVRHKKG